MAARFIAEPKLSLYRMEGMDSLHADKIVGALAHWRMVPGPYVPRFEEASTSDDWMARLCYACRAATDPLKVGDKTFFSIVNRMVDRKEYRLKAIGLEKLILYWQAQVFATNLPVCPPIGYIQRKVLNTSVSAVAGDGVCVGNNPKRCFSQEKLPRLPLVRNLRRIEYVDTHSDPYVNLLRKSMPLL
jgi:hypothetical protein